MKASVEEKILSVEDAARTEADCILVLGAGVREDGTPSPLLQERLDMGVRLYDLGASAKILMSGDHGRADYDEVNKMKEYAVENGVSSHDVFMDHAGFSTYESMYRARDVFQVKKINYHNTAVSSVSCPICGRKAGIRSLRSCSRSNGL